MPGKKIDNPEGRTFCAVLYPNEDKTHEEALTRFQLGCFKALAWWIDHDPEPNAPGEEEKKPHTHLLWRFDTGRYLVHCATNLGVAPNYVKRCSRFTSYLRYLIHKDDPDKIQYDEDAVQCSCLRAEELFKEALSLRTSVEDKNCDFKRLIIMAREAHDLSDFLLSVAQADLLNLYSRFQNTLNKIVASDYQKPELYEPIDLRLIK